MKEEESILAGLACESEPFLWAYLSEVLRDIVSCSKSLDRVLLGLVADSRLIKPAYGFLEEDCVQSRRYRDDAISRGASVIFCKADDDLSHIKSIEVQVKGIKKQVVLVSLANFDQVKGKVVHAFYRNPSHQLSLVGVTGTNGKTTVSTLVALVNQRLKKRCAVLGSRGWGESVTDLKTTGYTTPPLCDVNQYLWQSLQSGVEAFSMEVSSHGIASGRISGIVYDVAVLTNVTRDHLDYHQTWEAYREVKSRFFMQQDTGDLVLNMDDPTGRKIAREYVGSAQLWGYAIDTYSAACGVNMVRACDVQGSLKGLEMTVHYNNQVVHVKSAWIGCFNALNLLAAITACLAMGHELKEVAEALAEIPVIPGRMELISAGSNMPSVIVDYAHTPDAFEAVLKSLIKICTRSLVVVFGCGGDRDKGKRALMGSIAEKYANQVILTNDNPRSEDPQAIIDDIMQGISAPWDVVVETDRQEAIAMAIEQSFKGDIICCLGKGDEVTQIIQGEAKEFNDRKIASYLMGLKSEYGEVE